METEQPFVSIVTPVYNGDKYLAECIESVLAQSYVNWEYIILDNCSTDSSMEIAQRYAAVDSRIRICRNETTLPIMQNWNTALRCINPESKYCKVVHADDWLFPSSIELMVAVAERNPSVGLVGAYRLDENHVNLDDLPFSNTVFSGREICRKRLLGGQDLFGSPTSLMYRADLVRSKKDFYNTANLHADTEVCFDLLRETDFGFVYQVLSYTRRHNESESSLTRIINTHKFNHLNLALKYGPVYLTDQECAKVLTKEIKIYYRFLGKSFLMLAYTRRWNVIKKFWQYHSQSLGETQYSLNRFKLLGSTLVVLYNQVLHSLSIS
jgi:glycosyltransferase involved in cell wall biosynthesis